jgi:hypothetical protein
MKKIILLGTAGAIAAMLMACGGTSSSDKTSTAAAGAAPTKAATAAATTAASTPAASGTSEAAPTSAELSTYVAQLKDIMNQIVAKADAGDTQGARDTEATMDTAMEAVVKATRAVDAALADKLEKLELDIEDQADASTTDLSVMSKDAKDVLPLLDQITTTLNLTPTSATVESGAAPTTAQLSAYVTQLRQIMTDLVAKAQSGDVQATRDTEATMDTAMEAVIKATRAVDPAVADELEKLELDIEDQADASTTDLSVIEKDAKAVPAVLDKVVTALKLTP